MGFLAQRRSKSCSFIFNAAQIASMEFHWSFPIPLKCSTLNFQERFEMINISYRYNFDRTGKSESIKPGDHRILQSDGLFFEFGDKILQSARHIECGKCKERASISLIVTGGNQQIAVSLDGVPCCDEYLNKVINALPIYLSNGLVRPPPTDEKDKLIH